MKNEERRYKEMSDFLKTRRARNSPSRDIGLTWYTWLEQVRHIQVSAQVIESLSRVLLLDRQERIHLYLLANQPIPTNIPVYLGTISPALQSVLIIIQNVY